MNSLVGRHDVKEGNRRILRVLLGVMIFLVVFSVLTIMAKHGGINLP
jgi:hypothetical protein